MNNGAFGENFPYSNFHDLNMDWIIKIAKDFLDQYTHIQQTISEGEQSLDNKTSEGLENLQNEATRLEGLLNQWYDTHSEDIANELAQAIADFYNEANEKATSTIASIPDDYTDFFNNAFIYRGSALSTDYNQHLYEIKKPGQYYVSATAVFNDRPTEIEEGVGSVIAVTKFHANITRQDFTNSWGQTRTRLVNANNTYITAGIRADSNGWFDINDLWHGTAPASYYNNLISNLTKYGQWYLSGSDAYNDRPDGMVTGIGVNLTIEPFGGSLIKQIYFDARGMSRSRILNATTKEPYTAGLVTDQYGWFIESNDISIFRGSASASSFDNKLININYPTMYYISANQNFTDRPDELETGIGAMLTVEYFASTILKQTYYDAKGQSRERLVLTNTLQPYTVGLTVDSNGWIIPTGKRWEGKTLVTFGDSRTWYDGQTYTSNCKPEIAGTACIGYQYHIKKLLGMKIVNMGESGISSIAICNKVRNYDFNTTDAVLLAGGINDWLKSVAKGSLQPIGSAFNVNTVYGAWQSAIEYIMTNYPKVKIYIIIPAMAWDNGNPYTEDYAQIKRDVAELYNLPVLDLKKTAGMTTLNRNSLYADNLSSVTWYLHFNNDGNKIIGEMIAEYINTH